MVVTVEVRDDADAPVAGADVTATWNYRTSTPTTEGGTGSDGRVSFDRSISRATAGYTVVVEVDAVHEGASAEGSTSFTPRAC